MTEQKQDPAPADAVALRASDTGARPREQVGAAAGSRFHVASVWHRYFLVFAWIALVAIFTVLRPESFLTTGNIGTILGSQAVLTILALGVLLPLTVGDFDLSVTGTLTVAAMVTAVLNVNHSVPIVTAVLIALVMGPVVGAVNAFFILVFDIDPIIVTLGMGTFLMGVAMFMSDSRTIGGISQELTDVVVGTRIFGVPLEFYYALALAAVIWVVLDFTGLGRRLRFVGGSREVAQLSGIRVGRVRLGALMASGGIASLAGVLYAGTSGAADPSSGSTFLLPAFAAAFLGATSISPGRFNAWGTVVAAYFLITGITGLTMLGAGSYVQQMFYGGALVIAVTLSQVVGRGVNRIGRG